MVQLALAFAVLFSIHIFGCVQSYPSGRPNCNVDSTSYVNNLVKLCKAIPTKTVRQISYGRKEKENYDKLEQNTYKHVFHRHHHHHRHTTDDVRVVKVQNIGSDVGYKTNSIDDKSSPPVPDPPVWYLDPVIMFGDEDEIDILVRSPGTSGKKDLKFVRNESHRRKERRAQQLRALFDTCCVSGCRFPDDYGAALSMCYH